MKTMISIWFFIGGIVAIYGALILAAGLRTTSTHTAAAYAVRSLHLQVFWGIGMLMLGLVYIIRFRPRG